MDIEQIIFLIIALALSVFSMYRKSKKKAQSIPDKEESFHDFYQPQEAYNPTEPIVIFEPFDEHKLSSNNNIITKKQKKRQKLQNIETIKPNTKISENFPQDIDLENNNLLLEDFDGTEIQKAFLYSEIFKTLKNK